MERFGIPTQRIAFILNNPHGINELRRNEIQQALKIAIAAELPPSRDRGYGRAFKQLCAQLSDAPDAVKLTTLRQSTGKPIGDRREERRDFNPTSGAPNAANAGKVVPINGAAQTQPPAPSPSRSEPRLATADREKLKTEIHAVMMRRVDFFSAARAHSGTAQLAELRTQVDAIADEYLAAHRGVATAEEAARIRAEVAEEALGLGPIESLLADPSVSEIMVNGHANIFVEKSGHIERTVKQFADDRQVRLVIERIIAPLGRRLDESSPMVDARLPDGSRVNAVIEPLAIDGPSLTIRRFGKTRLDMNGLVERGALTPAMADFLRAAVEARLNVIVSGGTGSGKTTLLNSLSSFIPKSDRIVTVEDAAELKLDQPHVVRLESRPANLEGKGAISIRDLVRNSLRMRPDRIVVGECRSGEALDMLQAMNTGHDGSMTTIHANTPRDACARVETLVLMAGFDLPVRAIREQISGAIDVIVQVARLRDGSRKVTAISELVGMEGEVVTMQELVRFEQQGVDAQGTVKGEFVMSGVQPACLRRFEGVGVAFDASLFSTAPGRKAVGATWLR
ncbi:MAG: CpaF family protein [Candidatus Eremiobacteraeota bacterium]|nr:CpaF family protein [Candidatus Eremiobacteraeota bacterium]